MTIENNGSEVGDKRIRKIILNTSKVYGYSLALAKATVLADVISVGI